MCENPKGEYLYKHHIRVHTVVCDNSSTLCSACKVNITAKDEYVEQIIEDCGKYSRIVICADCQSVSDAFFNNIIISDNLWADLVECLIGRDLIPPEGSLLLTPKANEKVAELIKELAQEQLWGDDEFFY